MYDAIQFTIKMFITFQKCQKGNKPGLIHTSETMFSMRLKVSGRGNGKDLAK